MQSNKLFALGGVVFVALALVATIAIATYRLATYQVRGTD